MINRKGSTCLARICFMAAVVAGLLALTITAAGAKKHHGHHGQCKDCDSAWPTLEQIQALDDQDKYLVLYPNQWIQFELDGGIMEYLEDNAALKTRGPIDVQKLVDDATYRDNTPGVAEPFEVTEEMVRYQNSKYDPENPIRHDSAYAQAAGYQDILAYLSYGANDDIAMVPLPRTMRDKMLVSDLNHSITNYAPIYPGDTLYQVNNERIILDITPPEGSTYRSIVIQTKGSVYNQRYEKVSDYVFRVTEGNRIMTEAYAEEIGGHTNTGEMPDWWEAPDWTVRPSHYYTDRDWKFIKNVWKKEKVRGSKPLYWEDVKIGDAPAWTLEGPIYSGLFPTPPHGMGLWGSRTIKAEILDEAIFPTLFRSPSDGIYYLGYDGWGSNPDDQIPLVPGETEVPPPIQYPGGDPGDESLRPRVPPMVNFTSRDFAIRHFTNWMGDQGWIKKIAWSIMDPRCHAEFGKYPPTSPLSVRYLQHVPYMKCKYVNVHGLIKDIALVKSYVVGKRLCDGKHEVELIWWLETIEGDIWTEGGATVELPSKRGCGSGHGHGQGHGSGPGHVR